MGLVAPSDVELKHSTPLYIVFIVLIFFIFAPMFIRYTLLCENRIRLQTSTFNFINAGSNYQWNLGAFTSSYNIT